MIELIYNEEEETITEGKKLSEPKNIRKIGEPKEHKRIFVEDYVHTFLIQYGAEETECVKAAILLGHGERAGGKRHLYIKGALPVGQIAERQGKYVFTEKLWGDIYQQCERNFPEQEVMGWFLRAPGNLTEKTAVLEETHRTYFSGADKVLLVSETGTENRRFWGFDGNRFSIQPGYFIYYEKNEPMRRFLLEKNEKNAAAAEKPDIAVASFRKILKEKQVKKVKRKKQAVSYGTKVAVALVLFVGAVTLKNQTDKIKTMEQQISTFSEEEQVQEILSEEVLVEDLPGNVEETSEPVYEESVAIIEELPLSEEVPLEEAPVSEEVSVEKEAASVSEEIQVEKESSPVYEEYVVQAGDTLAKICREKYGTDEMIKEVCAVNEISDGDYIQEGEIILLP